jgi:sucrose-phosphate synthase
LMHFRRNGLPDVIHGHYADAGAAGAQLARLLHIPFVFTGHSLGRVKRQRLSIGEQDEEKLEQKYKFTTRIEGEETALETAAMVVTSTHQEVEQQYELYDHYQPDRMEVIPPGVDLTSFFALGEGWEQPPIADDINCFLRDPSKPMILTMARPDERKNLEMLVRVYGESEELQDRANLVLFLGTREDVRALPKPQRAVISNVMYLIDLFDLHGLVSYPKMHQPSDVPEIYRLAMASRGVFINPALTEPFGLTLLEAAASGLPVVATNDGGPRDIIANCENGLLIDPLDPVAIEKALLRMLTEPEQWQTWSDNGIKGAYAHDTWKKHVERYVRDICDIVEHSEKPTLGARFGARQIPRFDRMIITDLDNTLTGDDEALHELLDMIRANDHIGFGIATGRTLESALQLIEELGLPRPDVLDTDAGTQLHYGENLADDLSWQKQIGDAWKPSAVRELLDAQPGFYLQKEKNQSRYKVSYEIDTEVAPKVSEIKKLLREAGLRAKVVHSLGMYLDVIPVRGGSDLSMRHVLWKWGFSPEHVLVAGDSGNDAGLLLGRTLGVVVGNHSKELERLRNRPRIYFAEGKHARGIIEGVHYYNFLDNIVIPNDRIE